MKKTINLDRFKNVGDNPKTQERKNGVIQEKKKMLSFYVEVKKYNLFGYYLAENNLSMSHWFEDLFSKFLKGQIDLVKQNKKNKDQEVKRSVPLPADLHLKVKSELKKQGFTFKELIISQIDRQTNINT